MTTFTRISEDETPSISVDVNRRFSKIGNYLSFLIGYEMNVIANL